MEKEKSATHPDDVVEYNCSGCDKKVGMEGLAFELIPDEECVCKECWSRFGTYQKVMVWILDDIASSLRSMKEGP